MVYGVCIRTRKWYFFFQSWEILHDLVSFSHYLNTHTVFYAYIREAARYIIITIEGSYLYIVLIFDEYACPVHEFTLAVSHTGNIVLAFCIPNRASPYNNEQIMYLCIMLYVFRYA